LNKILNFSHFSVILKLLDPDPESASLMRIRIEVVNFNADPYGSGSETLKLRDKICLTPFLPFYRCIFCSSQDGEGGRGLAGPEVTEAMRRPSENNIIAAAISPAIKLALPEGENFFLFRSKIFI